jgi:hypothetical protein
MIITIRVYYVPHINYTFVRAAARIDAVAIRVVCDVEEVIAAGALQRVVAEVAEQPVVAASAVYSVVAAAASDPIITRATIDSVAVVGAREGSRYRQRYPAPSTSTTAITVTRRIALRILQTHFLGVTREQLPRPISAYDKEPTSK